MINQKWKQ